MEEEVGVLVDEADRVIGTAPRREIRARNLLHRGVVVVVRNSAGQVYVHRRTEAKDVFPGMYDATVGGMVGAGEGYDAAARREVEEELGISGVDLRRLFMHRYHEDRNNSWMAVYEVVWDGPIRHQESEISWGGWMTPQEVDGKHGEWAFSPDHDAVLRRYLHQG
jgi:isopentenyldiphosphate isomerase